MPPGARQQALRGSYYWIPKNIGGVGPKAKPFRKRGGLELFEEVKGFFVVFAPPLLAINHVIVRSILMATAATAAALRIIFARLPARLYLSPSNTPWHPTLGYFRAIFLAQASRCDEEPVVDFAVRILVPAKGGCLVQPKPDQHG